MNDQITTLLPEAEPAAGVDYDWAVEQFYEALYKFAFGLAGSECDAADLTQDTYRVLLTKGDAIRDARKVKSWLFTTLYRQFLGWRRHATRFPETPVDLAEWELPTITPQHADALDGSLVVVALQQLEEKYRAPLAMFYLEELSYKEMAEVLGLPIGTIMSRMSRGKEILRRRLQAPSPTAVSCRATPGGPRDSKGARCPALCKDVTVIGISRPANRSHLLNMTGLECTRPLCALALGFTLLASSAAAAEFDQSHALFDTVLKQYVKNARMDYAGLKTHPQDLNRYLDQVAAGSKAEIKKWSEPQQIAFLSNAYNAYTLRLVIDRYPLKSIKDIGSVFSGPWDQPIVKLFGETVDLNTVEHKIFRVDYAGPRLRFVLVCAAKGCPPLRSEAFAVYFFNASVWHWVATL